MKQKSKRNILTDKQKEEAMVDYYLNSMTYAQVAKKFNTSAKTICNIANKHIRELSEKAKNKRTEWQVGM